MRGSFDEGELPLVVTRYNQPIAVLVGYDSVAGRVAREGEFMERVEGKGLRDYREVSLEEA